MDILAILNKKRNKQELSYDEISFFIDNYVIKKTITDYQASALLMAIAINGMSNDETFYLTKKMLESGRTLSFDKSIHPLIDKHSTGGVGDKASLILAPICVAFGIKVAKLSGRGLGHTGGIIDKLDAIGVNTALSGNSYQKVLKNTGMFVMQQTKDIVLADKLLYALRNATSTVNCLPLIASSVTSKKLALKTDCVFLDVKVGEGSFCPNLKDALKLSNIMLHIFKKFNRKAIIHITNMFQPLGTCIGNAIEASAEIDFLKGKFENQAIKELIYDFISDILITLKKANNKSNAIKKIDQVIKNHSAYKIFNKWAIAQGSSQKILSSKFFNPKYKLAVYANNIGYISYKSTKQLGMISFFLGAGRLKKEDPIDFQAGIKLNLKIFPKF